MATERGWYYAVEPIAEIVPNERRIFAPGGECLTVQHHGAPGRVEVLDETAQLPRAALVRVAKAVGEWNPGRTLAVVRNVENLGVESDKIEVPVALVRSGGWALAAALRPIPPPEVATRNEALACARQPRVLFFESLMNAEMPHNDAELSQGVLHVASALSGHAEVRFANVKMAITGRDRPTTGMESVAAAVQSGPIDLVCITLLEGYFEGVESLIREIRSLGCNAHIAVGGVMPTLTPEHVAAHLPDVTFVCRGAGEVCIATLATVAATWARGTPLPNAAKEALFALDGVFAFDDARHALLASNTATAPTAPDLDRVPLNLAFLAKRHLAQGIELATSRGCLHKCTFCSIIGRESYQARSAGSVLELFGKYDAYYEELFGPADRDFRGRLRSAPQNAYRVHISDDDFACDRARALEFFRAIRTTPFRLASCQVSIADLCRRSDGKLLPEPDHELLDAITPDCFDDAERKFPPNDFVADHRSRTWSSYLQIGVESFDDDELARLGKGYRREHIRAIVAELDRRRLHHDAYFILSNSDTSTEDLIAVLDEVVRLKLRHPLHFHIRFPVVPHLVSYFPSASYRRRRRQGTTKVSQLRGLAKVAGYPEYDYPFVNHDEPHDPVVGNAVATAFFTDSAYYAGSYYGLREAALVQDLISRNPRAEFTARVLDDRLRRRIFEALEDSRNSARSGSPGEEARIRAIAEEYLGPIEKWLPAFQRYSNGGTTRLVVIPTWQCELRCNYCYIPKQDGRVMSRTTMDRSIALLLSSERTALTLQFFGGEALLEWETVQHAIAFGTELAHRTEKSLDFIVSSNGYSLDAEKLAWLAQYPVKLELSLDGDPDTQRMYRASRKAGEDSYENGIAPRAAAILASGLAYDVILVAHPQHIHKLAANYLHIAGLGFRRIQINFALGKVWTPAQRKTFADQLFLLSASLDEQTDIVLVNAENEPMPIRLNGEITVDWDGTIFGGNAFLHETEHKSKFKLGHLDDVHSFDRYWMDAPPNAELVKYGYSPEVTRNNMSVGAILSDFVRWHRSRRLAG